MAYGSQASLDHAVAKLNDVESRIEAMVKEDTDRGWTTEDRKLIVKLAGVVAYLADAVRYLKDGVP